jgi:transposase InsO family protein
MSIEQNANMDDNGFAGYCPQNYYMGADNMDEKLQEHIAAFRYGLISPIVSRQSPFDFGEIQAILEETSNQEYVIPGTTRTRVSIRSLERYIQEYRKNGWEGLKPKGRPNTQVKAFSPQIIEMAIAYRKERPERSIEQLIFLLEEGGHAAKGSIAASTLSRHLKKAGVSRRDVLADPTPRKHLRRFEAEDIHVIWQADFQHTLFITDPNDPKKKKKAMLFAILDDFSRQIVAAEFYFDEKLPRLEDSLKKAILRHGVPEIFYCDNGATFSSHHLARICGRLGIRLVHSRIYRPEGKGKCERLFRFIDTSFKPEAYAAIANGKITTLADLNQALASWIDGYYHRRVHGGIGKTPLAKAAEGKREPRRVRVNELMEIFLWEEERTVDKTGCISLEGNKFEVDLELVKQKIILRYDPFDLSVIQVWFNSKRVKDAIVLDLSRPYHRKVIQPDQEPEKHSTLQAPDFLALAEKCRREVWIQEPLTFVGGGDNR